MMLRPGAVSGVRGATAVTTGGFVGATAAVGSFATVTATSGLVSGAVGAAFAGCFGWGTCALAPAPRKTIAQKVVATAAWTRMFIS